MQAEISASKACLPNSSIFPLAALSSLTKICGLPQGSPHNLLASDLVCSQLADQSLNDEDCLPPVLPHLGPGVGILMPRASEIDSRTETTLPISVLHPCK